MQKIFIIPVWSDINISIFNDTIFFDNKNGKSTLKKPEGVVLSVEKNIWSFSVMQETQKNLLVSFYSVFYNKILDLHQGYFSLFKIKGINFKLQILEKSLLFMLGYSHSCVLQIPEYLSVSNYPNSKDLFLVKGYDRVIVGNFIKKIQELKKPNSYTGNGILINNQQLKLKQGKKK